MKSLQEVDKAQKEELNQAKKSLGALEVENRETNEKLKQMEANKQQAEQEKVINFVISLAFFPFVLQIVCHQSI